MQRNHAAAPDEVSGRYRAKPLTDSKIAPLHIVSLPMAPEETGTSFVMRSVQGRILSSAPVRGLGVRADERRIGNAEVAAANAAESSTSGMLDVETGTMSRLAVN